MAPGPRVIYWFRTDLRLHDSPALAAALALEPAALWPIFTWDPHYVYRARGGLNRWQFLFVFPHAPLPPCGGSNEQETMTYTNRCAQTGLPE